MASFQRATLDIISGSRSYLRAGEDDEKLLQCLDADTSDIEGVEENCKDDDYEIFNKESQEDIEKMVDHKEDEGQPVEK
ncbi:hypothetical protein ILUMI_02926 [Ignelater luminosus]|uniref:Uncharacterized protein n=1 Tax=Ignelater luminosus TaxID=2038154 RepID=A0A8K0DBR3_IGNLU|nr:hypothetical protein ILUMI_02926 [Ignelater luminosus]